MVFPYNPFFLVALSCLATLTSPQTSTTAQIYYIISNYPYSNGGLGTSFPIGPTNLNIPGVTATSFSIGLLPGVTSTIFLANGLLMSDYSLLPLGGFSYSYNVVGLPSWASYSGSTKSITCNPPSTFSNVQFNITYSDSRQNTLTVPVTFSQAAGYSYSALNYMVNNTFNSAPNVYTLIFPLFTTTSSSLSSIRANGFGALSNVAVRPWTNLIPIMRTSYIVSGNTGTVVTTQPSVITNSSGTYVNGVLISNSGYFTNITGTYYNGAFVGTGYITNSSGTYLNGMYVGAPGYVVTSQGVYYGGALVGGTTTTTSTTVNSLNGVAGTGVGVNSINTSIGSGATGVSTAGSTVSGQFVVPSAGASSTVNGVVGTATGSVLTPGSIVNPGGIISNTTYNPQYIYAANGTIIGINSSYVASSSLNSSYIYSSNGSIIGTSSTTTTSTTPQYIYAPNGTIIGIAGVNGTSTTIPGFTGSIITPSGQVVSNGLSSSSSTTGVVTGSTTTIGGVVVTPNATISPTV